MDLRNYPKSMRAVFLTGQMQLEVRDVDVPKIPPGGALIKVLSIGLCGSDINRIRFTTSNENRILGHEIVGEIAAIDDGMGKFKVGDRVAIAHVHIPCGHCSYCKHGSPAMCKQFKTSQITPGGYSEYIAITYDHLAHTAIAVPDHISSAAATFIDPLGCCMRAVHTSGMRAFDNTVVIGAGIMGQLFVMYINQLNANVFVVDVSDFRLQTALSFGATHIIDSTKTDVVKFIQNETAQQGADSIFLTFVSQEILNQAIQYARDGVQLCVFAPPIYEEKLALDFYSFFRREMKMFGSYSSSFDEFEDTLNWIGSKKVDVERLITNIVKLEELPTVVQNLTEKDFKIIIEP